MPTPTGRAAPMVPSAPTLKRYRIDGELGRGGMGAVYRAHDLSTGRDLALKTLASSDPRSKMLFEREYHVLASLKHPSVIEVFDFGVSDDGQRYYTMEILPGEDLSRLAPLPWRQACAAVRDIATSLALLHARRLVHRDVSPRNIRFDNKGRAKLFDFGALCGFGVATEIVGTPLCVAPEVARQVELDQRTDLFSLGVVLYMTLTGKRPFPVRSMHDVEAAHSVRPPPPSEAIPAAPRALDQLVMSMLSIDPVGRPASAAEVIERLGTLADLEEQPVAELVASHLLSTALCGREREKAQLAQHVSRTLRSQGSVVIIEGAAGMGRSRLIGELLIDARVAGMTTLRVDAQAHTGAHGVMRAIARRMLETSPAEATETLSMHLQVLGQALPELYDHADDHSRTIAPHTDTPDSVGERRARVQDEFVRWVLRVAERKPLLLAVDDVHATDATSAGVLIGLAHAARERRLLLVVTSQLHAEAPVAVQQLSRVGARIRLRGLSETALDQLVASAFGDVPHRNRLTHWLYSLARGNPAQSLALLSHLVHSQVIRYAGGAWELPAELSERDLPSSVEDALLANIAQLSPTARELAELLALAQGGLSIAVCDGLLPGADRSVLFAALDELVRYGIASAGGEDYRLRQDDLRSVLLMGLPADRVAARHEALAQALYAQCKAAVATDAAITTATPSELGAALQAGFHFLEAGDEPHARRLLRDAGLELTHRGDGLAEAIPALEQALAVYRKQGRHDGERAALLVPLTLAGSYVDFRLTYRYADELMRLLVHATGIETASRLARVFGKRLGLGLGLFVGIMRYVFTGYRHAARNFREVMLGAISLSSGIIGTATPLLDRSLADRTVKAMEPLSWFPRTHVVRFVYDFMLALTDSTHGRYAAARTRGREVLKRLRNTSAADIPEEARVQLEYGVLILLGSLDAYRTDGSVHETLAAIDGPRTSVSRQTAAGVRATYHANRGERVLFEQYQREVDVLAAQAGSTWRQDVLLARNLWWPYALCEDVMGLKHCLRQLEAFAQDAPSLAATRDAASACYMAERGMHAEALERYEAVLLEASSEINEMTMRFVGTLARLYRKTGQYDRAEVLCRTALQTLTPAQHEFEVSIAGIEIEYALALSDLGRHEHAVALLERMRMRQERHDNPLLRGITHKAWAIVALRQDDGESFRTHLDAMHAWFRRTDNPSLVSQCRNLADEGRRRAQLSDTRRYSLAPADAGSGGVTAVRSAFGVCRGPADRVQTALDLVLTATRAQRGYLYLQEPSGLRLAAPLVGIEPPDELRIEVAARLEAFREANDATVIAGNTKIDRLTTAIVNDDAESTADVFGGTYRCVFLLVPRGGDLVAVGAVALVAGEEGLSPVPFAHLEEIARGIYDAGDVATVYLDARTKSPANDNTTR